MTPPDYTTFRALSFDIYGTLIDWESSILSLFAPHTKNTTLTSQDILTTFRTHERALQSSSPTTPYRDIAAEAARLTSAELAKKSGQTSTTDLEVNVADWPAFPDTVDAMQRLKRHYKLIALSNIDHESFHRTLTGPLRDVKFDATYIAEDIGSYKPSQQNFKYLIGHVKEEFGVSKEEILMVAHGLETDHVPLKTAGMRPGVWIMRGDNYEEKMREYEEEGLEIGARFETLKEFADAVEEAWAVKEETRKGKGGGGGETLAALEDKGIGGS